MEKLEKEGKALKTHTTLLLCLLRFMPFREDSLTACFPCLGSPLRDGCFLGLLKILEVETVLLGASAACVAFEPSCAFPIENDRVHSPGH